MDTFMSNKSQLVLDRAVDCGCDVGDSWIHLPDRVKYLIFSGGAAKGYAHLGVLNVLESMLKLYGINMLEHMQGFGGCSFGAMLALACSLELDYDIIKAWFLEADTASILAKLDLVNFWQRKGLIRNSNIEKKIRDLISLRFGNPDYTFADLYRRTKKIIRIVVSNINDESLEIWDYLSHPNEKVIPAIVASMALPPVFEPVEMLGKLYVDGGLYRGCPVELFPAESVLVFRIDGSTRLESTDPPTTHYLLHLAFSAMEFHEKNYLSQVCDEYKKRTITIKVDPLMTLDLINPPLALRLKLIKSGENAAMDYFIHTSILGQVMRLFFHYKVVQNHNGSAIDVDVGTLEDPDAAPSMVALPESSPSDKQ